MTNKLTKDTEKRFDKKYVGSFIWTGDGRNAESIKQHLADELERQKKEIREELDKILPVKIMWEYNERIDQAIKTINDK